MGWLIFYSSGNARHTVVSAAQGSPDGIWLPLANDALSSRPVNVAAGRRFRSVALQRSVWQRQLAQAPLENTKGVRPTVTLPLPDGSFARFAIEDSPNMEAALAARFPEIKSYRAVGLDNPALIARFTWSPRGLYALIATPDTAYSVEPVGGAQYAQQYVSYENKDAVAADKYDCLTEEVPGLPTREKTAARDLSVAPLGATRRNYRLALATTYEYMVTFGGGNKPGAIASVNVWLNAVNLIYERDLSAHFNLVANNDQLIYDTSSDPFTNGSDGTMLEEARAHFNNVIGASNYDVGHVLGTGASGRAYIGVACVTDEYKGGGVSLIPTNAGVGHPFYIGRIAHELGHQFGTHHTFNDNTGNCASNRNPTSAYESGSGFTIMAYSGSCNAIAFGRALHFHSGAVNNIANFMQNAATCATRVSTGNNPPTVNAGVDRRIPKLTPFALLAEANDPDNGDYTNLTYSWEQYDAGGTSFGNPAFTDDGDPASTTRPIFRPFSPTLSPQRLFPELWMIQDYNNEPSVLLDADGLYLAQHLPRVSRNLNFKVIVRDQRGGVADDDVLLSVDGNAGPFQVTAPDTRVRWVGGTQQTVTWSVNNTNNAPVSCANVKISLSIDNGETFPVTILGATLNDGSETITVPAGLSSGETRIKVEAVGNIFFDMSDASFLLESGSATCPVGVNLTPTSAVAGATVNLTGGSLTGVNSVLFSNNVSASFTVVSDTQINVTVPAGVVAGPLTLIKSGCNNTQTPSFTPTACSYSLSATSANVGAGIQTASVNVTANQGCAWTATSNAGWITIASGAAGNGNGTVSLSVAANTGAARNGTVTVAGQTFTVTQAGGCTITLSATSASVAAVSGTGSFNVTAGAGCMWSATSNQSWVTISSGASGSGNGTVNYSVAANTGVARNATISVGGKSFTVSQAGGCSITISTTSAATVATSGTGSISVTAGNGCTWTAVSNQAWLAITSGASGTGSGNVTFAVAANPGVARSATITVNGLTFTLTQASGCAYGATISGQTFSSQASLGTVAVTTTAGCGWTASVNQAAGQSWLAVTTAASGVGNGTVGFALSPNTTGNLRQATLTVAGRTFIVSQDANCGVTLPTSVVSVAAVAGSGSAGVTTNPLGCVFNATSNADWLVITGKTSSAVSYSFTANSGAARTGSLSIGDKLYTVNQAAAPVSCAAYFTPVTHSASYAGGVYNVTVSTGNDCRWAATTSTSWITLDAATVSGVRRGAVSYSLATNTTTQARTGTIQVLGQTFSITQAAAPACSFSVSPGTLNVPASGGSTNVAVTATSSCSWSSSASDVAAQITTGVYGSGNGTVALMTQPNAASAVRTFKVVIAGQTVNVTQAGSATANPLPTAVRTYPEVLTMGATRTLTVYGRNFLSNSVVRWNGAERATTFVSNMELRATISSTDLAFANLGTAKVTVFNPASTANLGGGSSNALDCRVVRSAANVSAAHYGANGDSAVTPDGIVAGFGADLASATLVVSTLPLPTTLGGTTVTIYDSAGRNFLAPLFFVSPTQVNYLIPTDITPGLAEVIISDNAGRWESGALMISGVNPGLFTSNASGQGVVAGSALRVRNGVNKYENIARFDSVTNKMIATPIDLGADTDQVYLVLYGTGFRHRGDLRNVQAFIGGTSAGAGTEVSVLYLGAQGGLAGLDQTNLLVPRSLAGSGLVKLWLKVDGKWANPVEVNIK